MSADPRSHRMEEIVCVFSWFFSTAKAWFFWPKPASIFHNFSVTDLHTFGSGARGGLLHHHRADFLRPNGEHFGEGRADGASIARHSLGTSGWGGKDPKREARFFWKHAGWWFQFYWYFMCIFHLANGMMMMMMMIDDDDDDDDDDGLSGLVFFSGGLGGFKSSS